MKRATRIALDTGEIRECMSAGDPPSARVVGVCGAADTRAQRGRPARRGAGEAINLWSVDRWRERERESLHVYSGFSHNNVNPYIHSVLSNNNNIIININVDSNSK